jgi:hypothetical protein
MEATEMKHYLDCKNQWWVFSDFEAFNVRGASEKHCREVFNECKRLNIPSTLFIGINVVEQTPQNAAHAGNSSDHTQE